MARSNAACRIPKPNHFVLEYRGIQRNNIVPLSFTAISTGTKRTKQIVTGKVNYMNHDSEDGCRVAKNTFNQQVFAAKLVDALTMSKVVSSASFGIKVKSRCT